MPNILYDRSLIEISGEYQKKFLQGLITQDINKINKNNIVYSAMLNAGGRFLYDFFIFEHNQIIFLDCFAKRRDEIFNKLNFYKLRADVKIIKNDNLKVFFDEKEDDSAQFNFLDPRNQNLGFRIYKNSDAPDSENIAYHQKRISLKIPESEHDLTYEKSLILEFGFNELNAVSYEKGCYIGQELTARTHHLGEIRKKIFHIKFAANIKLEKNSKITFDSKNIGVILSSYLFGNQSQGLALIKILPEHDMKVLTENLEVNGNKIFIIN
jgi:tRNA-modifying protein YgfZ